MATPYGRCKQFIKCSCCCYCCFCCSWSLKHTFSDVKSISSNEQFTDCASCCCCCWCAILICYFLLFCLLWRRLRRLLLLLLLLHTHSHTAMQAMHTNALHIHTYTHTPKHSTSSTGAHYFFLFFLSLVTFVVYNLTQFNYIRIAVRYIYWTKSRRRRRLSTAINKTIWLYQFVVVFVAAAAAAHTTFLFCQFANVCVRVSKRFAYVCFCYRVCVCVTFGKRARHLLH